jgi:hypothetical protein
MAQPSLIISMERSQGLSRTTEPSASESASSGIIDGRLHRSMTTRRKIVTALETLIRAGTLSPTAEQVAVQAQVGLRTVFRHFDDMETL